LFALVQYTLCQGEEKGRKAYDEKGLQCPEFLSWKVGNPTVRKEDQKVFCNILHKTLAILMKFGRLDWIVSLIYYFLELCGKKCYRQKFQTLII